VKIAVVTNADGSISRHFGRAPHYQVFTVEDGAITATELRPKPGHDTVIHEVSAPGQPPLDKHARMIAPVLDCAAVIVGGMGRGGYQALQTAGVRPFVTDMADATAAVQACIAGTLEDHPELLH